MLLLIVLAFMSQGICWTVQWRRGKKRFVIFLPLAFWHLPRCSQIIVLSIPCWFWKWDGKVGWLCSVEKKRQTDRQQAWGSGWGDQLVIQIAPFCPYHVWLRFTDYRDPATIVLVEAVRKNGQMRLEGWRRMEYEELEDIIVFPVWV